MKDFQHVPFMKRCLELAGEGLGLTAPNPMVGAVITSENRIIGEGYHHAFGKSHAEVNAIQMVKDKELLKRSVLYVNLEPCCHHGKTPPCTDRIIETGIPEVVVGTEDPNPQVAGKGIEKLRAAGIRVITGVLAEDCEFLNRRFFVYHRESRPYIILKWAETRDGLIDMLREDGKENKPAWISNEFSKMLVHKWRTEEQGILVGTNTAFLDDPQLNVREWTGRSPVRMVLDEDLNLPQKLHLFDKSEQTIVFNAKQDRDDGQVRYVKLDFRNDMLEHLMQYVYRETIQSVIVEGGKMLLDSLLDAGLWDEARVFVGDKLFHQGIGAPDMRKYEPEVHRILQDELKIYYNQRLASLRNRNVQ